MRIAYLEPIAGLSGDIFLGALVDVGLPVERLQQMVAELGLEDVRIEAFYALSVLTWFAYRKLSYQHFARLHKRNRQARG